MSGDGADILGLATVANAGGIPVRSFCLTMCLFGFDGGWCAKPSLLSGQFPSADVDFAVGYGTDVGNVIRHDGQSKRMHAISSFDGDVIAGR